MLLILSPRLSMRGSPSHPFPIHASHPCTSTPLSDLPALLCSRNGESFVNGMPSQAARASSCQMRCRPPALPPSHRTIAGGQLDCPFPAPVTKPQ